jgi:hypothetical protein
MRVADRQLDADQSARDERPEELAPERLGLCLADVEATDLAPAGLVNGAVGRGQRGGLPAACGQAQRGVLQLAALAARSPPRSSRADGERRPRGAHEANASASPRIRRVDVARPATRAPDARPSDPRRQVDGRIHDRAAW